MSVSTAVHFTPERAGDEAGISAFQNENNYFALAVARTNDTTVVQLRRRAGKDGVEVTLASVPVKLDAATVYAAHRRARRQIRFLLRPASRLVDPARRTPTVRSSAPKKAGGFVGTMLGIYATRRSMTRRMQ